MPIAHFLRPDTPSELPLPPLTLPLSCCLHIDSPYSMPRLRNWSFLTFHCMVVAADSKLGCEKMQIQPCCSISEALTGIVWISGQRARPAAMGCCVDSISRYMRWPTAALRDCTQDEPTPACQSRMIMVQAGRDSLDLTTHSAHTNLPPKTQPPNTQPC